MSGSAQVAPGATEATAATPTTGVNGGKVAPAPDEGDVIVVTGTRHSDWTSTQWASYNERAAREDRKTRSAAPAPVDPNLPFRDTTVRRYIRTADLNADEANYRTIIAEQGVARNDNEVLAALQYERERLAVVNAQATAAQLDLIRQVLPPLDWGMSLSAIASGRATTGDYITVGASALPVVGKLAGSGAKALGDAARYDQYWANLATKPGTLSNRSARAFYLSGEARIPSLLDRSLPLEAQAQQAFEMRNALRTQSRDLIPDRGFAESLGRTDPNMKWSQVIEKYSGRYSGDALWNKIISSPQKSRQSVNQPLGF